MKTKPTAVWPVGFGSSPEGHQAALDIYMSQPFTVYRQFDAAGVLLYVGVTDWLERRNNGHRHDSPWWPQVARIDTELCLNYREALAHERWVIQNETPLYNVVSSPDRVAAKARRAALRAAS